MNKLRSRGRLGAATAFLALLVTPPVEAQIDSERLLRRVADASRSELALFESGAPLIKTLAPDDDHDLVQVAAVRVSAPVSFVMARLRASHLLLDAVDGSEARGFFRVPPEEVDLDALSIPRSTMRALRRCEPYDCDLKLPLSAIEALGREIDWADSTSAVEAGRFLRRTLVEFAAAYMSEGDSAGLTYNDKPEPLRVSAGFDHLYGDAVELQSVDGGFASYLSEYPRARSARVEDLFTWTVEDLGVKSLVSLNHIVFKDPAAGSGLGLVGVKRFYAGHYFWAGLTTIIVGSESPSPATSGSFVLVVDRRRFDGEVGGLRRVALARRLERHSESVLGSMKAHVESAYAR